ncbi:hypothetical protein N7541_007970 [Penicillium brevicompactum]|uniref:Uncharacterized protein n=1 Tax=Penicillium brevicompactum TaxID=5074 RepID=A0A9W9UM80_PENBR|nr:hypothetical protein N7541_007970 [Penicillium brevicompactum]
MVPPARPSETQRDPARPQRGPSVSILFDVPRQIQTTKTKAMNSSSSRLMQEFEQSLRTILHAHALTAAGAANLWGCLFAGNQVGAIPKHTIGVVGVVPRSSEAKSGQGKGWQAVEVLCQVAQDVSILRDTEKLLGRV